MGLCTTSAGRCSPSLTSILNCSSPPQPLHPQQLPDASTNSVTGFSSTDTAVNPKSKAQTTPSSQTSMETFSLRVHDENASADQDCDDGGLKLASLRRQEKTVTAMRKARIFSACYSQSTVVSSRKQFRKKSPEESPTPALWLNKVRTKSKPRVEPPLQTLNRIPAQKMPNKESCIQITADLDYDDFLSRLKTLRNQEEIDLAKEKARTNSVCLLNLLSRAFCYSLFISPIFSNVKFPSFHSYVTLHFRPC
jgi:hypothetical protein